MTPAHIEHRFETPDGRTIAAAEWGDPAGVPLIVLHGTPGGRISYWHDPSIDARHGIRRITFDRPGYGESTRLRGRIVADVVPDVVVIADALGFDRFAVAGGSGGGPHALACAALLPERIARCAVAVSIAPFEAEGLDWFAGQTQGNVDEFKAALQGEDTYRQLTERERKTTLERLDQGRSDFFGDTYEMAESDRLLMAKHLALAADQLTNGLAHGVDGWVDDGIAFTKPWGFDLSSVRAPLSLTYGRQDTLVPAAHGDWLAAHLQVSRLVINDESGHMGDDSHMEADYAWIAAQAPATVSAR
jgi:pimeloyl-ACP methyl ester carboxylesterase